MFSPKEENVRKKFSQKMFKNMKHFPNMFKKKRDIQAYCQVSVGRDVRKGPGRGFLKTNFQFLWVSGGPGRGKNFRYFRRSHRDDQSRNENVQERIITRIAVNPPGNHIRDPRTVRSGVQSVRNGPRFSKIS